MMSEGAWIFLSHSNKDFDRVRELRNGLEAQGHRPLMFFLKALAEHDEIFQLIEREIEARSWFILCDSKNAQDSPWVRREKEIIKALPPDAHTYIEIRVDDGRVDLLSEAEYLTRRATVFLSHSLTDREVAEQIRLELLRQDFGVFDIGSLAGPSIGDTIEKGLDEAATQGAVLILLSSSSVRSSFVQSEIRRALDVSSRLGRSGHILPIFLGEPWSLLEEIPVDLAEKLSLISWFVLNPAEVGDGAQDLMRRLRSYQWATPGAS